MFLLAAGYRTNISRCSSCGIRRTLRGFPSLFSQSAQNSHELRVHKQKPGIIFVLGGPGAGKGTQCELISKEFGIAHLSAGELLRQERLSGSENGQLIDAYLKEGRIVPVSFSLSLLQREMQRLGQQRYLIDGFPRNYDNLHGWMETMSDVCDIELILFIECDEEVLTQRLLQRGLTSNRNDDNLNTIKKRFRTFDAETLPVIRHFQQSADSFHYVGVNGAADKRDVYRQIEQQLLSLLSRDIAVANDRLTSAILARNKDKDDESDVIVSERYSTIARCESDVSGRRWLEIERQQMLGEGLSRVIASEVKVSVRGKTAQYDCTVTDESQERRVRLTRQWRCIAGQWSLADVRYTTLS